MFLPQPQLDDTRWTDLVDESRGLIPFHAPEWTDHNASDPGMTFVELLAWIAEMQVFQLDQVPASHRRAYLALAGVRPRPPRPARTLVAFAVADGAAPVELPAGLECGDPIGFRTRHALTVVPGAVAALGAVDPDGVTEDLSARWRRGEPVAPFGADPRPGCALTVALTVPPPAGAAVTLGVATPGGRGSRAPAHHHDAVVVWEVLADSGAWVAADVEVDDTRALTRDGRVVLRVPDGPGALLRARHAAGAFDAVPSLVDVVLNGVDAEQAVALTGRWEIAPDATIAGTPAAGTDAHLGIEVDLSGAIVALDATEASAPAVGVLAYRAPQPPDGPGEIVLAARWLGRATGDPEQRFEIPGAPVDAASIHLLAGHGATWRRFTVRDDLRASGPDDAHVTLDATTGRVTLGDGAHGWLPRAGDLVLAGGRTTLAQRGAVPAGTVDTIAAVPPPPGVTVTQPLDATGGAPAESLGAAESRAAALVGAPTRAVTLADTEALALETPGTRIARVAALGDRHPAFPCVVASGIVTVVVVPHLPAARPYPSPGLRHAVARHLCPRRIVGTRIEVTGPTYVEVTVRATVAALRRAVGADVSAAAVAALDAFLDPLRGGPAGDGWPFGREVVRAEVLQVVDDVAGVDHVVSLDLIGPDGASCGNLCLGRLELVAPGAHEIAVMVA